MWGHYDSAIPIYAWGTKLAGRRRSASPDSAYALQIKNFDSVSGLSASMNAGEAVTILDFNAVSNHINESAYSTTSPTNYWKDFDWSGVIEINDVNMLSYHINHDCQNGGE
jgi:hypothetical protein